MSYRVPLKHPRPDVGNFIDTIMGRRTPPKPPMVEYIVDSTLMGPILEGMGRKWIDPSDGGRESEAAHWDNYIEFWYRMGYDFVRLEISLPFQKASRPGEDPTRVDGLRSWQETGRGSIGDWEDFERYPWPKVEDVAFRHFEYISSHLPEGMGLISCHAAGIFEHVSSIMGYETLCLSLYDDPDLVEAVCKEVGSRMVSFYERLLEVERLAAIFQGDDMGFRSGTLVSPDQLRKFFLPWHRRFAEMAHSHGLPYFLHSCGNIYSVMEDLIEAGVDAKHSFEDAILPASEFQSHYGDRVGTLGGADVDVLARRTPDEVRRYVRKIIEICHPRGRFAIGSGNSIPSYIPLDNYLTMLDEALS